VSRARDAVYRIVAAAEVDNPAAVTEELMTQVVRPLDGQARMWCREAFRLAERDGWFPFGTHIDQPGMEVETDGLDECRMPFWERPARHA
jgi:hypothetical protein